jgi:hypothetical protein
VNDIRSGVRHLDLEQIAQAIRQPDMLARPEYVELDVS